jgi:hypothetical protein
VGCNPLVMERDFACIPATMESQLKISIVHTQSYTSTTTSYSLVNRKNLEVKHYSLSTKMKGKYTNT